MDATLISDIKLELGITWSDENTDIRIENNIKRGIAYLTDIAGVMEIDFSNEGLARDLLFDYCRYANSHATEMFEENFRGKLLRLNNKYQAQLILKGKRTCIDNKI